MGRRNSVSAWFRGKSRGHHTRDGKKMVEQGALEREMMSLARRLGVPYGRLS